MRLDTGSSDQEDFTFDYADRVTLASKSFDANDAFSFGLTGNINDLAGATHALRRRKDPCGHPGRDRDRRPRA